MPLLVNPPLTHVLPDGLAGSAKAPSGYNPYPYNATKAAVVALSETLYAELAPHGVAVSVVCPSFFRTNLLDTARLTNPADRARASMGSSAAPPAPSNRRPPRAAMKSGGSE